MAAHVWSGAFWAVVIFVVFLAGCGGDSSNSHPRGNANVSGNWHATITSSIAPTTTDLDMFIVQSGTSLASTLVLLNGTPCASQGTLTGTVDQQAVDLTIRESDGPDSITVPGSTDGITISGSYSISGSCVAATLGLFSPTSFHLSRVPAGLAIRVRLMARLRSRQICARIATAI